MYYDIVGLIILVLDIIAIVHIIQSGMQPVKQLLWVLIVLLLPVIGMVLWFAIGDKRVNLA